jgi:hypothetical protein
MYYDVQWPADLSDYAQMRAVTKDIALMITGVEMTDPNLSEYLDTSKSTRDATIPTNWEMHDSEWATANYMVRSPVSDDPTNYKYMHIYHSYSSNHYVNMALYEGWDNISHTGNNNFRPGGALTAIHYNSSTASLRMRIWTTNEFVLFTSYTSTDGGASWSKGSYSYWTGVAEHSRMAPWDTVAAGYPPYSEINAYVLQNGPVKSSRLKRYDGVEVTGQAAYFTSIGIAFGFDGGSAQYEWNCVPVNKFVEDASGNQLIPMFPMYLTNYDIVAYPLGNITEKCDIWFVPKDMFADMDRFVSGSKVYEIVVQSYAAMAVRVK